MTSCAPVTVNTSRPLAYRAIAVEQIMKRNMLVALGISILIHAVIVVCYYLLPSPAIDMSGVKLKDSNTPPWTRKPFDFVPIDPRTIFSGAPPKVSDAKAGRIVSVPDAIADPKVTLATQNELKNGLVLNGESTCQGTGVGLGPGDGFGTDQTHIGELDEPEPGDFVAVERDPILVRPVVPNYPELMVKAGIEGTVWVKIWVNRQGKPHEVRIVKRDNELFNEAAVHAAKQFLFTPAYMNSGPVSVWVTVPFRFRLK